MNKELKCYVGIICLSLIGMCIGTQEIQWTKTLEKEESNGGFSVLSTEDGFVIGGYIHSMENISDFWLLKISEEGNEIWSRTYDNDNDVALDVTKGDDGYIISGTSSTNDEESTIVNLMIVKTDWEGREEWSKIYSIHSTYTEGRSIQSVEDGYVIAGNVKSPPDFQNHGFLMKIDKEGKEEWSKIYGGEKEASISCVMKTDEDYVLLGITWPADPAESNLWLQKVDKNGEIQWSKIYDIFKCNWGQSMLLMEDGFVIAGYTSYGTGGDFWLLKVDKEGKEIWSRTYDNDNDVVSGIVEIEDGFIIVGDTSSFPMGQKDVMIIKIDRDGKEEWREMWGIGERDEIIHSICKADSCFMMVGVVMEKEKTDLLLIKIE